MDKKDFNETIKKQVNESASPLKCFKCRPRVAVRYNQTAAGEIGNPRVPCGRP